MSDVRQFPLPILPSKHGLVRSPNLGHSRFLWGHENAVVDVLLTRLFQHSQPTSATSQAPFHAASFLVAGGSGTGKSLLLHNVAIAWSDAFQPEPILLTSTDFSMAYNAANKAQKLPQWRAKLRKASLLLIDDAEAMVRFPLAQREFCLLIDELGELQTPLVISTSTPPSASQLSAPLRSRLTELSLVRLLPPGVQTKRHFIRDFGKQQRYVLDNPSIDWLAEQLQGSLLQIRAQLASKLSHVDGQLSKADVVKLFNIEPSDATQRMHQISQTVASLCSVTLADLKSASRKQSIVRARNVVCHVAREHAQLSFYEIGRYLGERDHSTIMHACRRIKQRIDQEPELPEMIDEVVSVLKKRFERTSMLPE